MTLPIQFFATSLGVALAYQSFVFGMDRFIRFLRQRGIPTRLPPSLNHFTYTWFVGGLLVLPFFALSTILCFINDLLVDSRSVYVVGIDIKGIPYFFTIVFSLVGWIVFTSMIVDVCRKSLRPYITMPSRRVIAWSSILSFVSTGISFVILGELLDSLYTIWAGLVLSFTGLIVLITWLTQ